MKRFAVGIMFVCLVLCTSCSKKAVVETNKPEVDINEEKEGALGDGADEEQVNDQDGNGKEKMTEGVGDVTTIDVIGSIDDEPSLTEKEVERQESLEAYENFMRNESKLSFHRFSPKDYMDEDLFEKGNEYTLSELLHIITDSYFEYSTNKKVNHIEYSYIDCGMDEVNELILRFHGMDIYGEDDNSTLVYIIKYIDGKLELCHSYETWARSESTINEYGYYSSYGSGGASLHIEEYGLVDEDGNWNLIASVESELDLNQLSWSDELGQLPAVAMAKGISTWIELQTIYFDRNENEASFEPGSQEHVYTFNVYDDNMDPIQDENLYTNSIYKDIFDEAKVAYVTADEVSTMISLREEKVGASAKVKEGKEITWRILSNQLFSDYVGR